jgi:hypothetical protein
LDAVSLDCPAEKLTRPEDMLLADEFVKGTRPHARRQRLMPPPIHFDGFFRSPGVKQVLLRHGGIISHDSLSLQFRSAGILTDFNGP